MRTASVSVPRSTTSCPSSRNVSRILSRRWTPRWSKATATFTPRTVPALAVESSHERRRALARAGTTAAGRRDPPGGEGGLRPSHVGDVGGRPHGRADGEVPALRLRQPARPPQRPARLLEGARVDAYVRAVPRRARAPRRA